MPMLKYRNLSDEAVFQVLKHNLDRDCLRGTLEVNLGGGRMDSAPARYVLLDRIDPRQPYAVLGAMETDFNLGLQAKLKLSRRSKTHSFLLSARDERMPIDVRESDVCHCHGQQLCTFFFEVNAGTLSPSALAAIVSSPLP
jgi:hypothetical protein